MAMYFLLLISLLGSSSFRVRERSQRELEKQLDLAIPIIKIVKTEDLETQQRLASLKQKWNYNHLEELVRDEKPINWKRFPPLNGLDPDLMKPYYDAIDPNLWYVNNGSWVRPGREATQQFLRHCIVNNIPTREIMELLCKCHISYCKENELTIPPQPIFKGK